jgi:hypothetical protein
MPFAHGAISYSPKEISGANGRYKLDKTYGRICLDEIRLSILKVLELSFILMLGLPERWILLGRLSMEPLSGGFHT